MGELQGVGCSSTDDQSFRIVVARYDAKLLQRLSVLLTFWRNPPRKEAVPRNEEVTEKKTMETH